MANPTSDDNQLNVQGYNIVTILKRLEAATSRLEDITIFQEDANKTDSPLPVGESTSEDLVNVKVATPPGAGASAETTAEPVEKPKSVVEFDRFIADTIEPFVVASHEIDPVVGQAADALKAAFEKESEFLELVTRAKKPAPSDPAFAEALAPINAHIEAVNSIKDAHRKSEFFNHLNTISEGVPVLGWVATPTPISYIPEFKDSAQFWANRVIKDYRDKDAKHGEWVKAFLLLFEPLKAYVKEFHTAGPSWNPQGKELGDARKTSAPPAAGGPPPPPPPPPPAPPATLFEELAPPAGGMNAVFAALNQGENVTSGLKKVEKSQMTHKNPELRSLAPVASSRPAPPKKPATLSQTAPKKKPARKELVDGSKWIIENFTAADAPEPIVIEAEMLQSVFVGNTSGITVQIKGKANAVSLSETTRTGVVVESLISGVDVIKSVKFGVQVTGVVPLITVDQSDEGAIYLSQESIDAGAQVVTSNTVALNINVPKDGDFAELAAPEQFKHSIKNGKLVSEVVEHVG